jgi:hypothetical protein
MLFVLLKVIPLIQQLYSSWATLQNVRSSTYLMYSLLSSSSVIPNNSKLSPEPC